MWILARLRDYPLITTYLRATPGSLAHLRDRLPTIAHFCTTLRNNAHLHDHPPIIACPHATLRSIAPSRAPFHMFLTLRVHQTMFAPPRWCAKTPCFIARRGTNLQHLRSWWLSFATLNTSLEIYESHIVVYYCILDNNKSSAYKLLIYTPKYKNRNHKNPYKNIHKDCVILSSGQATKGDFPRMHCYLIPGD
mgnify:FL=1